jgi:antitoxin VapB
MLTISHETEELARRLALKIGKAPEDVIADAVQASARILGVNHDGQVDQDAMLKEAEAIALRCAARPTLDTRTEDEILGYDQFGIPQ